MRLRSIILSNNPELRRLDNTFFVPVSDHHIVVRKFVTDNYIPYSGAVSSVNLNNRQLVNVQALSIGLITPLELLHVGLNARVDGKVIAHRLEPITDGVNCFQFLRKSDGFAGINVDTTGNVNFVRVGINTTTPAAPFHVVGFTTSGTGGVGAVSTMDNISNHSGGASILFRKARGVPSALLPPVINDIVGGMVSQVWDGTAYRSIAAYRHSIENIVGSEFRYGMHEWRTVNAGVDAERMRMTSAGWIGLNTTTPTVLLDVNGQIRIRGGTPAADRVLRCTADGTAFWSDFTGLINPMTAVGDMIVGGINGAVTRFPATTNIGVKRFLSQYRDAPELLLMSWSPIDISDVTGINVGENYIPKRMTSEYGNSSIIDVDGNIGILINNPIHRLSVGGNVYADGNLILSTDDENKRINLRRDWLKLEFHRYDENVQFTTFGELSFSSNTSAVQNNQVEAIKIIARKTGVWTGGGAPYVAPWELDIMRNNITIGQAPVSLFKFTSDGDAVFSSLAGSETRNIGVDNTGKFVLMPINNAVIPDGETIVGNGTVNNRLRIVNFSDGRIYGNRNGTWEEINISALSSLWEYENPNSYDFIEPIPYANTRPSLRIGNIVGGVSTINASSIEICASFESVNFPTQPSIRTYRRTYDVGSWAWPNKEDEIFNILCYGSNIFGAPYSGNEYCGRIAFIADSKWSSNSMHTRMSILLGSPTGLQEMLRLSNCLLSINHSIAIGNNGFYHYGDILANGSWRTNAISGSFNVSERISNQWMNHLIVSRDGIRSSGSLNFFDLLEVKEGFIGTSPNHKLIFKYGDDTFEITANQV